VLSLDNFLGLLGDSVKLDILCPFFKVLDFQVKTFLLVTDFLKVDLEHRNVVHQLDLHLSLAVDFLVFVVN